MSGDHVDNDQPWPIDLGYIVCDACFDGRCDDCVGLTHSRPFCGHRCGFLEVIDDVGGTDDDDTC